MDEELVTGVVAKNSLAYVREVFNSYKKGSVVVLLRSANDQERIQLTSVTRVVEPTDCFGWFDEKHVFSDATSLAQISFTSGTEGEPKGVLLTHQALSDVTKRLNDIMETNCSIREYVGVPAHFSFGLGRFRAISAVGGAAFLPAGGFNPVEIRDMLKKGEINAVSAVPTLWRVLLKNKAIFSNERLGLKWIEIGSQYMSQEEKEELKELFPSAIIVQHYGLTEASRSCFLRVDQVSGERLGSVGFVKTGPEVKISESGNICIRGSHVAEMLLKKGEYARNVNDSGWFETNDLGEIRDDHLYFLGRADDLINCGGIKLSPDTLERSLLESLKIKEGISVASYNDETLGNGVLVCLLKGLALDEKRVTAITNDLLSSYGIRNNKAAKIIELDDFPITTTGKVKRNELTKYYESKVCNAVDKAPLESSLLIDTACASKQTGLSIDESFVLSIWERVLKTNDIDIDSDFYMLGGDSLTAISAVIEMDKMENVPDTVSKGLLQGLTIREIAKQLTDSNRDLNHRHQINTPEMKMGMTINIVRGLLVLFVIFAHWSEAIFERLPDGFSSFSMYLSPMFAMGTAGFALIYGAGAGYSLFPIFRADRERFQNILYKTVMLLACGILVLGLIKFLNKFTLSESVTFTDFTNSFYSVLTYYLLVTLTLGQWFKAISYSTKPAVICLFLAISFYIIHTFGIRHFGYYQLSGIAEFIKLLFTAKYSYFLMLSGTMVGISIGLHLRQTVNTSESLGAYCVLGISVMALGIVMSIHAGDAANWLVWPSGYNYIWKWIFYTGAILFMLSLIEKLLSYYDGYNNPAQFIVQFFSIVGMLAFPLFITHEMVLPMKSILANWGLAEGAALILPLALFLASSYWMFQKVRRVSFL